MANNSRTKRRTGLNNKLKQKNIDNLVKEKSENYVEPSILSKKRVLESTVIEEVIPILDVMDDEEVLGDIEETNQNLNDEEFIPILDDEIINNDVQQEGITRLEEFPQNIIVGPDKKVKNPLKRKYLVVASILSCLVIFVVVMGMSYAFFTTSVKGKEYVVYTGNLAVDYQKKTDIVSLDNVYPMMDKDGLKLPSHDFTIINNGNIDAKYQIRLELDEALRDMVDIRYIRISYQVDNGEYTNPVLLSDLNSSLVFVRDVILSPGRSNTYGIKLWIDLNAPNDIQGKVFKAKIVVDSIQNVEDGYVVDTAPIIYLNKGNDGNQDIHLKTNEVYTELGINRVEDDQEIFATDQVQLSYEYYDGKNINPVDSIDTSKNGIYYITYSVTDRSGNVGKSTRIVTVNLTDSIPSITLNGNEVIHLGEGDYYKENGVIVADGNHVVVLGEVKTSTVGVYTIRYIVLDSNGNMNSVTRTVNILKAYQEPLLNGADPVLSDNLVPVIIDSDGTVKKSSTTSNWYSYEKKNWANAVVLKDDTISYENNSIIPEENIESYFVWIPRYKYKLFDITGPQAIDIIFEDKNTTVSKGSSVGEYLTHPAFTAFDTNGLWVGKFETGYEGASSTTAAEVNNSDSSKIVIKPNVYSWRSITVGNMFEASYNYKRELESHMMKNTEWGAVAYLMSSNYGRCENGSCSEVRINNNSNFITGYASVKGTEESGYTTEGTSPKVDGNNTINYLNSNSVLASTTGNRSGIYDMSGGAWEYVMGYTTGASTVGGESGITATHSDFFTNSKWNKYYDKYSSTEYTDYNNRILGDATGELGPFNNYRSSWYQDLATFVNSSYPWFLRGGHWNHGSGAGSLAFYDLTGDTDSTLSFRVILTP